MSESSKYNDTVTVSKTHIKPDDLLKMMGPEQSPASDLELVTENCNSKQNLKIVTEQGQYKKQVQVDTSAKRKKLKS